MYLFFFSQWVNACNNYVARNGDAQHVKKQEIQVHFVCRYYSRREHLHEMSLLLFVYEIEKKGRRPGDADILWRHYSAVVQLRPATDIAYIYRKSYCTIQVTRVIVVEIWELTSNKTTFVYKKLMCRWYLLLNFKNLASRFHSYIYIYIYNIIRSMTRFFKSEILSRRNMDRRSTQWLILDRPLVDISVEVRGVKKSFSDLHMIKKTKFVQYMHISVRLKRFIIIDY